MRKIIYILIAALFFTTSCEEEDKIEIYELGAEFLVSSEGYTSLDDAATISITNNEKNLSSIALTHNGGMTTNEDAKGDAIPFDAPTAALGNIAISGGSGSITLTDDQLGMTEIGWSADFTLNTTFDGKAIERFYSINVKDPISTEAHEITHRDTVVHFQFEVAPVSATVTGVTLETKKFWDGTYSSVSSVTGDLEADSIAFNGNDYNIGDTIYVKLVASAGTKTATTVTKFAIGADSYDEVGTFTLNTTANLAYDFIEAEEADASTDGEAADIEFTSNVITGGYELGFVSNQNAEFVVATADDYANADIKNIEATDFTSAITADANVMEGNIYIFKTKRGTDAYFYGIMKVTKVDKPQGVLEDSSIEFEYKYAEPEED